MTDTDVVMRLTRAEWEALVRLSHHTDTNPDDYADHKSLQLAIGRAAEQITETKMAEMGVEGQLEYMRRALGPLAPIFGLGR